jgi:hypothetical protein
LNFVWGRIAPLVRSRQAAENYHQAWFHVWTSAQRLIPAVEIVFNAALHFYRARRGKGARAIDVSSFFKRKNQHVEFDKFWRGSANKRRLSFQRIWTRYEKVFNQEVQT